MDTILFFHTSQRQAWRKELSGAYRFARARGWRVQVVEPPDGDAPPQVEALARFWTPVGCIAECSGRGGEALTPDLFAGIPTVFLGSNPETMPGDASFVSPSPSGVGALAARELLSAGFSSFAFVAADGDRFWSRDREREFSAIVSMHGHECRVFRRKGGGRASERASSLSEWLVALPKPCGLLAENDYAAAETLDLARRLRLRVPAELAVVGADNDTDLCENSKPTLTSVALDFEAAGFRASEILDAIARRPGAAPMRETYPALGIIRRGSTPVGAGVPPRILDALSFIRERACEGVSAATVAARMPGSRRLSEIEFRRATGRSILEEIMRVRFENVEQLLRDRSRSIGAIAGICGWRSETALRAAFRKRHGLSMRDWREANAGRTVRGRPGRRS